MRQLFLLAGPVLRKVKGVDIEVRKTIKREIKDMYDEEYKIEKAADFLLELFEDPVCFDTFRETVTRTEMYGIEPLPNNVR